MSGFIAIYNTDQKPVDRSLIYSLTQTLKFRGPDQQNVWVNDNIGMGHALFKTTFEAEYENQPSTLDQNIWITCSARIDDRENLVKKLGLSSQINLNKTPDSDLILYAYKKWNEDCLEHLLGDFAFAIWDSRLKKLFCAKDRFGMRQLYYVHQKNSFIIANSINTLLQHPDIPKKFNDKSIAGFLLYGDHYRLNQSLTAFENINALKPAHYLIIKNGTSFLKKYWDIPTDIPLLNYKKEQDYVEHFQEVFQASVYDRIRASSIVIAMSGGMDSSTIAATAKHLRQKKSFDLHAITAIYEKLIPDNERYYANLVAKHLHIPIHFVNGDKFPMIKSKFITTSPMQLISPDFWFEIRKQSLQYSRVTLAGYAGDSLLEYSTIKKTMEEINPLRLIIELSKTYHRYGHIPSLGFGIKNIIKKIIHYKKNKYDFTYPSWISPEFAKNIKIKELCSQEKSTNHMRHPQAYHALLNANWNSDDFLYTSPLPLPEVRDPFLDTRVVELLFSFPALPWFYKKHILRSSMETILPNEIIKRPKTVIGNLSHAYLQNSKNAWIDEKNVIEEISAYIDLKNIPPLLDGSSSSSESYINLRPFYLNEWMKNVKQLTI